MKQMPMIEKYMTAMPHTINPRMPIKTALQMMREHGFRHLPAQNAGRLVGILTERDIKFASSSQESGELTVEDRIFPAL
jgi:acetoin utilization protein AcuB